MKKLLLWLTIAMTTLSFAYFISIDLSIFDGNNGTVLHGEFALGNIIQLVFDSPWIILILVSSILYIMFALKNKRILLLIANACMFASFIGYFVLHNIFMNLIINNFIYVHLLIIVFGFIVFFLNNINSNKSI